MNQRSLLLRFGLPILVLLPLPFVYNSCQKNILGGSGFSSQASLCKVTLEKGVVTKLNFGDSQPPPSFAAGKVRLRENSGSSIDSAQQKSNAPLSLAAGSDLSVILDNTCVQNNLDLVASQQISQVAVTSGQMLPGLDRQAYRWVLDRDFTDSEIENFANSESCVVGVAWNKTYHVQSMSFNDSNVSLQSHLTSDRAFTAYDYFYNSNGGMALTGAPVIVAVVDTGADLQHPDLNGALWTHSQGVGVDITTVGTSQVNYSPYDVSSIGHGTHVSGMIAAVANNNTGIVGAMPFRAQVMPIKVFAADSAGNLSTTSQYFYNAMKFAYLNGANVINLSLGAISTGTASDPLAEAGVDEAVAHGVVVVTVIGNADTGNGQLIDGVNMSSIPGQYASKTGVIGVGAYDTTTGAKSYFSHYSTTYAEIGAPGEESSTSGLYSTLPVSLGSYGRLSGTSQAAPQVSAAAALTIGLIRGAYGIIPSPGEVERLIEASAVKSSVLAPYFKSGNKLDLTNLVRQINIDYPKTADPNLPGLALNQGCQ